MAVMEVVLEQSYAGQQCINRFNYVSSGTPASVTLSFALASALGAIYDALAVPPGYPPTEMMRVIADIQNTAVTFENLTVKDVYSVTDFYSLPFVEPLLGTRGTEGMSPINAIGFYTNRVRTDVRRATKRFTGVAEGDSGNLGLLTGSILPLVENLAVLLSTPLIYDDEGNTITFTPAVCGKERYDPDTGLADPNGRAYRYFPNETLQMQHTALGVLWNYYPEVRSQTSRQYRRGR